MKIYSWNVNGIRAAERKGFIEWVENTEMDILCIQETKAHVEQLNDNLININGYKSFFNSGERKGYSGTAVYYKKEPNKIWTGLPDEKFNNEGRTINMEYDDFVIMNIYFPNGKQKDERLKFKMEFYDELLDYANKIKESGKEVIICGDVNTAHNEIDLKNPESNSKYSGFLPEERAWIDKFLDNGYKDTFRELHPDEVKYSWWSYRFKAREKNVGWRIDYFYVSDGLMDRVKSSEIHNEIMGSDHCPISLELN